MPDMTSTIAIVAAILGAASLILHVVAPRTKTTVDDRLRDDIDEVLAFVRSAPIPAPPTPKIVPPTLPMFAVLLLGLGLAMQPSCATVKAAPEVAATAIVDCVKADQAPIITLVVQLAADALTYVLGGGVVDWGALESAAWAQGKVTGGCALAEFVHGLTSKAVASVAHVSQVDPARAALERLRARAGGVHWQTPGGLL